VVDLTHIVGKNLWITLEVRIGRGFQPVGQGRAKEFTDGIGPLVSGPGPHVDHDGRHSGFTKNSQASTTGNNGSGR
jgi:hypothetical protein